MLVPAASAQSSAEKSGPPEPQILARSSLLSGRARKSPSEQAHRHTTGWLNATDTRNNLGTQKQAHCLHAVYSFQSASLWNSCVCKVASRSRSRCYVAGYGTLMTSEISSRGMHRGWCCRYSP